MTLATRTLAAVSAACVMACCASTASAQLLVGVDDTAVPAFLYDFSGGVGPSVTPTPLSMGVQHWGLAADDAAGMLYSLNGAQFTTFTYAAALGGGSGTTVPITSTGGSSLSMTGLAYGNGTLWGVRNVGGDGGVTPEALYSINTTTGVATVVLDYLAANYDFGGLAFNADDGLIYGTSDDTSPLGSGLYTINPGTGAITFVTAYPTGETDLDGLAVGGGYAFLAGDGPAGDDIYAYNLGTGLYEFTIPSPFATGETFSGATWAPGLIPEPASMALAGLGGLALLRRRAA